MNLISGLATVIAGASIVIYSFRSSASAQTVSATATVHRSLIRAALGESSSLTPCPPTPQSYLTPADQEWVQKNLNLTTE